MQQLRKYGLSRTVLYYRHRIRPVHSHPGPAWSSHKTGCIRLYSTLHLLHILTLLPPPSPVLRDTHQQLEANSVCVRVYARERERECCWPINLIQILTQALFRYTGSGIYAVVNI